jgi:molybdenum cofactor cytidylyltransferase
VVDETRVREANRVHEALTVATLRSHTRVGEGDLVATAKVIPLAVRGSDLEAAAGVLGTRPPAMGVRPFRSFRAALVLTELAEDDERLRARGEAVIRDRLTSLGSELVSVVTVPHAPEEVAGALRHGRKAGCDLLLVLGASAVVDRGDVVPRAVERAGGTVRRLGIPVDPGNLLLLASLEGVPVVGVPGCARSPRPSGFDTVLERLAADLPPTSGDLAGLAVGGLLREIPSRPQPRSPRSGRARSPKDRRVAALVLAAGRSRRMGGPNKLLQEVDGAAMVARVVDVLAEAPVDPVLVVTGHDAPAVEAVLRGRSVELIHNPRHAEGMGTSVACGVRALAGRESGAVDGVLVCLADMPRVSPATVRRLVSAFRAAGDPAVCVPVHREKRGNPVLWGAAFFGELAELGGDVGARGLLAEHIDALLEVPVDDPGVLLDVDTREALDRLGR